MVEAVTKEANASTQEPIPPRETEVAGNANPVAAPKPSWFTPLRLLIIFCIINLVNYMDRGVIASNGVNGSPRTCSASGQCKSGTGIQGNFNLSNFQDGVLSSAFMVGLLVFCPIFASLTKSINPFRLIGVGLSVWTLAVVGCGFSFNFWTIAVCRMLVGVGEASFISLAAPFIDDNAPTTKKTAWLGIFFMCIPTGYAIGYVYGGFVGGHYGWRYAFWGEAILMLPFAILGFCMKPLPLKGFAPAESKQTPPTSGEKTVTDVQENTNAEAPVAKVGTSSIKGGNEDNCSKDSDITNSSQSENTNAEAPVAKVGTSSMKGGNEDNSSKDSDKSTCCLPGVSRFLKDMKVLLLEKVFVVNVLGYIAYNFVLGAYSYWGPKAGYSIYNMSNADMIFGGITIVGGIFGTIAGGYILDCMTSTIPNAFKLLSATTFLGAAFCFAAFCMKNMYVFLALFAIGEVLVFATQGPVNYICLHCVRPSLRPLSMAISTVSIHILGDVPSSPLVGVLQDHINNWRVTALTLTAILFPAAVIWFIGVFLHAVDRFNEESEHPVTTTDKSDRAAETLAAEA